ncbi:shikimate kinase [Altererythrobacter fulvus]|uniref:shikimate kinase n=1 Tax=Caenibius fulvus TaxID=2126012 RepID=UPI00301639A2
MTKPEPMPSDAEIEELAARINRPIALVGMMGVGKSTVGRKLATLLHLPFIDADEAIEKAAQMSVSEIFTRFGEPYFRDGERRVIARLAAERPSVIATGGGAFVNDETRQLLLDKTICIWLDCDTDTLVERVGRKDTRPLLRNGDPHEIITRLKAEREPFYSQAPIHVMSEAGPYHQAVQRILKGIEQWL